ncbi:MAG TPA: competence/damage-inducible protein A [Flavobacteriaceae bacterium]|nr:competence/damage-inducible protein A [Flavobacteriaceae bacterium]
MTTEIITIGDEILIGQIVDTNSAFISKELNKIGIEVRQVTSVSDEKQHILSSLKNAAENAEIVIVTGGLGPTKDDITKQTLCGYFEDELVFSEEAFKNIEKLFAGFGNAPISEMNRQQAFLPSKAKMLLNEHGSASGMWFEENGTVYISLPGVPLEMKALMRNEVLPKLQEKFKRPFIVHKTVLTYGMGESTIAEKIAAWEENLPSFIKLAYLPGYGMVRLRLSARGTDEVFLKENIEARLVSLHKLIGANIKGYEGEDSLQVQIAKLLTAQNRTLATAESCTGGKIASLFTENPGASSYFKGSVVAYATTAKTNLLGIPASVIEKHSAVSEETSAEMAKKAQNLFQADYVLATTGNAGPTKGDSDAEIGTVFIALASPKSVKTFSYKFGNHREKVINKAVNKSFELLLEELLKE